MQGTNFKTIEQWFSEIEQGQLVLPRFQRHPAWKDNQVAGLFENILRKPSLPIGVLLTLDVGDEQPFHYRPIDGAPKAAKALGQAFASATATSSKFISDVLALPTVPSGF